MAWKIDCERGETHVLYRPIELAHRLGVSVETVNRYRREGFIDAHPMGSGFLFSENQIEEFLQLQKERGRTLGSRNRDKEEVNTIYV